MFSDHFTDVGTLQKPTTSSDSAGGHTTSKWTNLVRVPGLLSQKSAKEVILEGKAADTRAYTFLCSDEIPTTEGTRQLSTLLDDSTQGFMRLLVGSRTLKVEGWHGTHRGRHDSMGDMIRISLVEYVQDVGQVDIV